MAQGYTGYTILENSFTIKDSPNLDAFSRLRVSNPLILHNAQFTYDLAPIIFQAKTNGTGATVTHDTTNRCALMTFASTPTGGKAFMQSYEYLSYQPGRSQLVFVTFNMIETMANTLKFAGYSDGTNGVEFQLDGTTKQFKIYSGTTPGNETVAQSNWNLDKLDGTGPSGYTLDITKTQILVIDIQALYVGRVRIGFDIGGKIIYAHEFLHANLSTDPYIQTANLPIRCGMTCTGTVSTTMKFVCSAVISEGGSEDINTFGYTFSATVSRSITASPTQLISLRPKSNFNSITNRIRISYLDIEIFNDGGTGDNIRWDLCVGQAVTGGTWTSVNATYSGVEYNSGATLSGSPAVIIDSGWITTKANAKGVASSNILSKYPITLDIDGNPRDLGTLTLLITPLAGSPTVYANIKFREIR